jgi:hypothetical protein
MMLYLKTWVFRVDVIHVAFDIERATAYNTKRASLHSLSRVALPDVLDLR